MAFANLYRKDWEAALARDLLSFAPATPRGVTRQFSTDHLIAARVYGSLRLREVMPKYASQIATEVYRLVSADHGIQHLAAWKLLLRHGEDPEIVVAENPPSPTAIELFRFEIASIRIEAMDAVRAALAARQAARRGSPP